MPFQTTNDEILKLAHIVVAMEKEGLEKGFIVAAYTHARTDQGMYDLMALWKEEKDVSERDEIIADIQEAIDAGAYCLTSGSVAW